MNIEKQDIYSFYLEDEYKYLYSIIVNSNINNITKLYTRDEYKNDIKRLRCAIELIYTDPDTVLPIFEIEHKNKEYRFSADGICSWKILFDIFEGDKICLEKYKEIRRCYLYWPCHMIPTLNTIKRTSYLERLDLMLRDISIYLIDTSKDEKSDKHRLDAVINNARSLEDEGFL